MICLDTNYLIGCLVAGSQEAQEVLQWIEQGEPLITPMHAWFEFLCGPVTSAQIEAVRACLTDVPIFDERQAAVAAQLFNAVGRKRNIRVDAIIAAVACAKQARLATRNKADFVPFLPYGLQLL